MYKFTGGEFIVMGVPGQTLDSTTRDIIEQVQPAGFILFARNIKSPEQLRNLTDELRQCLSYEPIITIDQEGGRVSRLKEFMTEPPTARALADYGDIDLINAHGHLTGKLLRLFGFNLNLAPVLDTLVDEKNENSLKDRTYGSTTTQVIENAGTFTLAMAAEGILCCGKHFPGYSYAQVDPHNNLPVVDRTYEQLMEFEWIPFKEMLPLLDLVMVGHVSYPQIDPSGLPASLSATMVHRTLRLEWNFGGCTITDDMDMGAIKTAYGSAESAVMALAAGNDLMLVCHSIQDVPDIAAALARQAPAMLNPAHGRITILRNRLTAPSPFSWEAFKLLDDQIKELKAKLKANVATGS